MQTEQERDDSKVETKESIYPSAFGFFFSIARRMSNHLHLPSLLGMGTVNNHSVLL